MDKKQFVSPVITGILVIGLLYVARSVFGPLAFSLFAIALVWPVQIALERHLPKLLALFITLTVTAIVIVTVGSAIVWGFTLVGQWLIANTGRLEATYLNWGHWLEERGIAIAGPLTETFDVTWFVGFLRSTAQRLQSSAGFAGLVFIFVMLGLLEVDDFNNRLKRPAAQPYGVKILRANAEIGRKLRRFMLVRSFASILTGLGIWIFALSTGLELAAAWGAIGFALNYIPFLGSFVATLFPTLFAIAQYDSWQMVVIIFAGLNIIQFITGSYIEPRLTGATLTISPFAVILAVFFWSFMWGLPGAFIGVPILIVFVVYCEQEPSGRWLATLLSSSKPAKKSGA
ncbi:MAG TPA: AI-2E family transporter [Afipia sp.]